MNDIPVREIRVQPDKDEAPVKDHVRPNCDEILTKVIRLLDLMKFDKIKMQI